MMDFGLSRAPECFGDSYEKVGRLMLWCSRGFEGPFKELLRRWGIAHTETFALNGGIAIALTGGISDGVLFHLARLLVLELVAAFDLTGQELAQHHHGVLDEFTSEDAKSFKRPPL